MWDYIIRILLVSLAVAFIYAWGIIKQQRKNMELLNELIRKSEDKIINGFKNKERLTNKNIEEIIVGTKASLFWTKDKIQINDPKMISKNIITNMLSKGLIVETIANGQKFYCKK